MRRVNDDRSIPRVDDVARQPPRLAVAVTMWRRLSLIVGAVVVACGVAMLPAAATAALFGEWVDAGWILLAAVISAAMGFVGWRVVGRPGTLTNREGFAGVGLSWFALALFGTLPYLLTGSITSFTDAFFETAAGFTTTGSSIVADPSALGAGILLWRSVTQWIGGMGVILLSVAILPYLGVGGVALARAESPGPEPDRLTPRFADTAKRLWLLYVAFTAVEVVLLAAGEMTLFQAIAHALTTMSTGGFGTESDSLAGFGAYTQWVVIVFMFLAGASFALHFRALRAPGEYARNAEFRLYVAIWIGAILIIAGGLLDTGERDLAGLAAFEQLLRDATFTATTIMTTTGYATADFGAWAAGLQVFVVGLMFLGGMAGSTAGGVKTFRLGVLAKTASADLRRLIHPRAVFVTRFGRRVVPDSVTETVQTFFLFYMFLFMTGTFVLGVIGSQPDAGLDLVTGASAAASALGNIGPGLGDVGPANNYAGLPAAAKWVLSMLMVAGRLEIFPVLLLLTRALWRRR